MLVVTFYTDAKYKAHALEAKASAERFGLPVLLVERPETSTWTEGIGLKPGVILEAMEAHPNEDILYVDADCRFRRRPVMLEERREIDVAWNWVKPRWPHGCVLFFRANKKGRGMVELWKDMFDRYPIVHLDEVQLFYAYDEMRKSGGVAHLSLPPAYTWMENWVRRFPGSEVVIEHLGAGRAPEKERTLSEGHKFLKS